MTSNDESQSPQDEVLDLLERTNLDDPAPEDVKALRQMLETYPSLWRVAGDLAHQAVQHLVRCGITGTAAVKELLIAGWDGVKTDLGYSDAPMLEKLLIEQVALCWLRLYIAEQDYTNRLYSSSTYEALHYWEKRINASQRRYLRAIETLARVRKIIRKTPTLQINIAAQGGQQVNVVGDVMR